MQQPLKTGIKFSDGDTIDIDVTYTNPQAKIIAHYVLFRISELLKQINHEANPDELRPHEVAGTQDNNAQQDSTGSDNVHQGNIGSVQPGITN